MRPKKFQLDLGREEILAALNTGRVSDASIQSRIWRCYRNHLEQRNLSQNPAAQDAVTERALGHPEVQRSVSCLAAKFEMSAI